MTSDEDKMMTRAAAEILREYGPFAGVEPGEWGHL